MVGDTYVYGVMMGEVYDSCYPEFLYLSALDFHFRMFIYTNLQGTCLLTLIVSPDPFLWPSPYVSQILSKG